MTGELVRISDGPIEVEVLPSVGARLHRIRVFGHELMRTPDDLRQHVDDPWFWGGYPMAPWCNRLPVGSWPLAGRTVRLEANFPDGTAIHGQVATSPWQVGEDGGFRISGGGDGWPWRYDVEQRIAVADGRLKLGLRLTNRSDDPMPGGIGFHPWFVDPVQVAIRAERTHPSNFATKPLPEPVAGWTDRRELGEFPEGLDATWADLADPPVILAWPDTGIRATMRADAAGRFIVAARPPGIPAVAVEPETQAPDGARRLMRGEPGGLQLIAPGETLALTATIAFERT